MIIAPIPYFDVKRQYKNHKKQLDSAVRTVIQSGQYVMGRAGADFEKAFAKYCGVSYGIGVGSGTDALIYALRALDIKKGDEVIVPSFTFTATVFAVRHVGATPVYADVDERTYTLCPAAVNKLITKKTKAIIPVHLYGQMANMTQLLRLTRQKRIKVIEDAAQAHGAMWGKKKAGSCGDAGCFSFYPTKNLGAFGDGGMVVTSKRQLADNVRRSGNLGRVIPSEPHQTLGWTSRLDEIQAAVLKVKLGYLEKLTKSRRNIAERYNKKLKSTPLVLPYEDKQGRHVYHLFVVRVPKGKRDALRAWLKRAGIPSMVHYDCPVHLQPAMQPIRQKKLHLPVTNRLSREILSLPLFPEMKTTEVDRVCLAIQNFYKK